MPKKKAAQGALFEGLAARGISPLTSLAVKVDVDVDRPYTRPKVGVYQAVITPEERGDRRKTKNELARDIARVAAADPAAARTVRAFLDANPADKPRRAGVRGSGAVGRGERDIPEVPARLGAGGTAPLRWRDGEPPPGWDLARQQRAARALRDYSGASYVTNFYLRDQLDGPPPPQIVSNVEALDDLMQVSKLDTDVEAWRGLRAGPDFFGTDRFDGDLVGYEWVDPAFGSTSTRKVISQQYATEGRDGVLLRIRVPAGMGAAQVQDRGTELNPRKAEMLLERGVRYRIVADHGRQPGWGYRLLDVEAVPPEVTPPPPAPRRPSGRPPRSNP